MQRTMGVSVDNYRNLWVAVLGQAIKDLSEKEAIRESAINWLRNKGITGVGSFLWICDTLHFDPDKIRAGIFKNFLEFT